MKFLKEKFFDKKNNIDYFLNGNNQLLELEKTDKISLLSDKNTQS